MEEDTALHRTPGFLGRRTVEEGPYRRRRDEDGHTPTGPLGWRLAALRRASRKRRSIEVATTMVQKTCPSNRRFEATFGHGPLPPPKGAR